MAPNHFRLPFLKFSLYDHLVALLKVMEYEFPDRQIIVHLGWPLSSWWDRLSIGVMVFNLMRLPRKFPKIQFHISYTGSPVLPEVGEPAAAAESSLRQT
jgi:hypothetical protein